MTSRTATPAGGVGTAYRRLAVNTTAAFGGRLAAIVLALVVSTALFRTLGAVRYGIWSFCYMLVGYLTLFDLGLAATVERLVARAHAAGDPRRDIERILNHAAASAIVVAAVIQAGALAFSPRSVAGIDVRPLAWVMPACLLLSLLAAITGAALSGIQALARLNLLRTQMNFVSTGLVLLALALGVRRVEVLVAAYAAGLAGAAATAWWALRGVVGPLRFAPHRFDRALMREFVRFGGVVQAAIFGPQLADQLFRLLLGIRFGPAWMGCYDLGSRAAVVVRSFTGTLLLAMVPFGVQQQLLGGQPAVERLHRITLKYTALFLLPASALAFYHAPLLVSLWLGRSPDTASVLFVFRLFLVVNAAAGLAGPITMLARAAGTPGVEAVVLLTTSALGLGIAVLAPHVVAAVAGFGATSVLGAGALWWQLSRRGIGAPRAGMALLPTVVLAALIVGLSWLLQMVLPAPDPSPWPAAMVAGICIGVPLAAVLPLAWASRILTPAEREFWKSLAPGRLRAEAR